MPCCGELRIECARLPEESNRALGLIECSEIPPTINQHGSIDWEHLEAYYVIFLKPQGVRENPISMPAPITGASTKSQPTPESSSFDFSPQSQEI